MIGDNEMRVSVDRYLETVRAQAVSEIARALREAMARGNLSRQGGAEAGVALTCDKIGLNVTVYGKIDL